MWISDLSSFLKDATRVAIIGVGSEVRGDDAAGVEIIKRLRTTLKSRNVLLVEGGLVPENFTSKVKKFKPSHIIFIDATDFGGKPGEIIFLKPNEIKETLISTHTLPLSVIAKYLQLETNAQIALMGVQPAQAHIGVEMSKAVRESVKSIITMIKQELMGLKKK